ncbi:MAG: ABC transporter ATP-binding protein [Gammaproteobacteria bacterium]|nr:ABC transporter ATP-binding protein [Gammaproteobacteria bacterium]
MSTNIRTRETFSLIRRATVFVWPLRNQLAVKLMLGLIGITAFLIMPWPLKALIDHVIVGMPIGTSPTRYPPFAAPLVDALQGLSPFEMVFWIVAFSVVLVFLIGAFGSSGVSRDATDAETAEGYDTATRSENMANVSNSIVGGLLGYFEYRYQLRTTHRLNHRFRSALFKRLLALPMTHFSDASVGDAVYRVVYDTPSISRICYELWIVPILSLYTITVAIWVITYSYSVVPSVVWAAWAVTPAFLVFALLLAGFARKRSTASREAGAATTATIEEGMSNIVAVQSLGASKHTQQRFEDDSAESFKRFRAYYAVVIALILIQSVVGITLILIVFLDVAEAIIKGQMTAGDYAVLFAYFILAYTNAQALGQLWFYLQDNIAAMQRVFQIIDLPVDAQEHGDRELPPITQGVTLEDVSFSYADGTRALTDVSIEGKVGEMIAIVGATGAGKTTLSYLIPAFIAPTSGRVLLDGQNIQRFSIDSVRRSVAFVFQEPMLFDDTIENNIRLGHPDASIEDITAAARVAGALEFIERLPDGFQTRTGQAGGTLSVGQKQRLAIARGLVSPANVLILDEPTASLDPETENALISALNAGRESRLLIVIAHRLSTIRTSDRIYFLDDGENVESGSHDELMQKPGGAYRRFVELQLGDAA